MTRKRRDFARTVAAACLTFAIILVLEQCGWLAAGNDILHQLYFRWGPERQSAHRVIVLSVDSATPHSEPSAWTPTKLRAALNSVMQGNPAVVALINPEETFSLSTEQVGSIVQDPGNHHRIVVANANTHSLGGTTGVTSIEESPEHLAGSRKNALETVSSHIAQSHLETGPFPINFLKSREAMPRIPFWTLLANNTQRSSLQGNVILIGPTRGPKADLRNTPIGPMSSLEIHAHAISGLIDSATWEKVQPTPARVFLFFLILAWSFRLAKQTRPGTLRESLAASAACLALDGLFFFKGFALWGPCSTIAGIWIAQFMAIRSSLLNVTNKVGYLQTRLAEMLPEVVAEKKEVKQNLVDDAFWQDLVDFGRGYLQLDFEGMIAELPDKEWHIQFRASTGSSTRDIAEQRRDIRRAPFRSPFLTQRCGWAKNFVRNRAYAKSLVVPLHHQSKLFGYWLLHMKEEQELDDSFLRTCEALGRQMASVIAQQRGQQESTQDDQANRAQRAVLEVERDVKRLELERSWAMQVIEQNPSPILMASIWGPVELMNERMRERMSLLFPSGIPDNDIRAVVAKLCAGNQAQVQTLMRSAVVDPGDVLVPDAPDEHETFVQGDYRYLLRSIEVGENNRDEHAVPNINQVRILLVAQERDPAQALGPIDSLEAFEQRSVPVQTDEPSANDYEPRTQKLAPPEPFPNQQPDPEPQPLHEPPDLIEEDSVYYDDGWEDWIPRVQLDPRDDLSLPSKIRAAS